MRLNWARSARRRAKLGKQLGRRRPPLDKQTRSRRWKRGGGDSGGTGREGVGPLAPGPQRAASSEAGGIQDCWAALAFQRVVVGDRAQGSILGSEGWVGREKCIVRWEPGAQGLQDCAEKMEKRMQGGGEREK